MEYEDFSERANEAINVAVKEARRLKSDEVLAEHLFLAMLGDNRYSRLERGRAVAYDILKDRISNMQRVRNQISDIAKSDYKGKFRYSSEVDKIVELARGYVKERKETIVGTEHLLYAIASYKKRSLTDILNAFRINPKGIEKDIKDMEEYGKIKL